VATLTVVNIKCGGCEKKITDSLARAGLSQIAIDVAKQTVSFEGDTDAARKTLSSLGYPEAGSPDAASRIKKGHSYISCAIGRLTK
jgi:copper chaperone CopZ